MFNMSVLLVFTSTVKILPYILFLLAERVDFCSRNGATLRTHMYPIYKRNTAEIKVGTLNK